MFNAQSSALPLPAIVEVLCLTDAGAGGATCPHCGAIGRFVYRFRCADGTERGAMRGCIKLFPMHRYEKRIAAILAKEKDCAKKGRALASWDIEMKEAIRQFAAGVISEYDADRIIWDADRRKSAYMTRRGYR